MAFSFRNKVRKEKFGYARRMRNNPTPAEAYLWRHLCDKQLGFKFRFQSIIFGYIADFYCPEARLVVEVDGSIHDNRKEYDLTRSRKFATIKLQTIRFSNNEVLGNTGSVLAKIRDICVWRVGIPLLAPALMAYYLQRPTISPQ
jgi:very-short-patch-repair endonuclease